MTLTPDAKQLLSRTIRSLRDRLLTDLHDATESAYRLGVPVQHAGLDEERRIRRRRLEAWIDERARATRPKNDAALADARKRFRAEAEKQAAATLLNRLVLLRHLEALGLSKPAVVTGGWNSKGYRELRDFAPDLLKDETEGYATLLGLVFDELTLDLPGLYGDVGVTRLVPVPPATLRAVVEALDDDGLASAWTDDTTLGWVYQYWNDPEREDLDKKLNEGGKIEPHEIASKTQMFTERYMVEWLLQNSLGLTWLAMCRKHGWRPDAESVLDALDRRRAEWRAKRDAGEVALDALMPIHGALEDRWKYWVPQPIPEDAVATAPDSVRELKLLDPACGSGHFLVIAFDLLAALYEEEARHRGEAWSRREIAESIVENNLHGVDIDPRAVQIAAAALYVKWRSYAKDARPKRVNLVAPALHLSRLPDDDPALVQLRRSLAQEAGIPEAVTNRIVNSLSGVDHLGTLLKVDKAIDEALEELDRPKLEAVQGSLFGGMPAAQAKLDLAGARKTVLDRIEDFLAKHGAEEDLGLRLDGEELAGGLRFLRIVREGTYTHVCGNPPYQGTTKMADAAYVAKEYPEGKADLYAAFLLRGLQLAAPGGTSALLTMRGWMFLGTFSALRADLLRRNDLRTLCDVDRGAFDEVPNEVLAAVITSFRKAPPPDSPSVAVQPTPLSDKSYDRQRTNRKRAAVLLEAGRHEFKTRGFEAIEGEPVVYWWTPEFLAEYRAAEKLGQVAPARFGLTTGDNGRFVRQWFEVSRTRLHISRDARHPAASVEREWAPFILGSRGRVWMEPLSDVCRWRAHGLEVKEKSAHQYGTVSKQIRNEDVYFKLGIAFAMIGNAFSARAHRYASVIGNMGSSVYPDNIADALATMNTDRARFVLGSLNPGVHFEVGDVNRLPVFPVISADQILAMVERAFTEHESAREASAEFRCPGPSSWTYAQDWAQRAIDRAAGEPLPPYEPIYDPPKPVDFVSFAFGVAMGRFGADREGLLDEAPATALPGGILFLSAASEHDGLKLAACAPLHAAWAEHGAAVGEGDDLRTWLRIGFFAEHKARYENRPIYFPLSSAKKSFVAWVSIHRWRSDTLQVVLADHLMPELRRLEGEIEDLKRARAEKATKTKAERRFAEVQKLVEELRAFVDTVTQIAEAGPPPTDDKCPRREADARFEMDLDDGVMVNSAALWPLLDPQWKDPKKWWKELATAQGRKDYDWSHLAARYFPKRVEAKCHEDPSLAVAHRCFWRLHRAKAYAWELRLQDEIRPDFTIDEPGSDEARATWIAAHPQDVEAARRAEMARRERKKAKAETEAQQELADVAAPDDAEEAE